MFIIASVRLYVWINCCKDSQTGQSQISWGPLALSVLFLLCKWTTPPMGLKRSPQSFFFHIHLIKWTVHEESFYSHVAFHHWCLVFSPRGEMEREDSCVLVFRLLKQCVCADTAGTDSSQGESHTSLHPSSLGIHTGGTDSTKWAVKNKHTPGSGAGRVLWGPVLV